MIEIESVHVQLGSIKIYNQKIEKKLGFKKNQIIKKTGIIKRYIGNDFENTETLAIKAVKKMIRKNKAKNLSHIISVTNTPTILFPSLSHIIHSELKMPSEINCIGVNAGCTGFLDALFLAYKLIKKNKKILIVTSDTYSKFINSKDRSTIPLFSDGASATLIKYSKKGLVLKKSRFSTTNKTIEDLCCKLNGSKKFEIKMNGPNVLSFAISEVLPVIKEILNNDKKTILFCHQAGKIVIDEIKNNLNENIIVPQNYSMYGNLVSTSIPNLINKNWENFKKRKIILFSGFGVGLSQTHLLFSR